MDEQLRRRRLLRTQDRTSYLLKEGYAVVEMWECEFKRLSYKEEDLLNSNIIPPFSRKNTGVSNMTEILNAVLTEEFFGAIEVDIEVPKQWSKPGFKDKEPEEYFSEMSPLFCTCNIGFE